MEPATYFGQRLRARRTALGLTLSAVAIDAGLSVPYVANLEKGRGNPTLDVVVGLARALHIDPAELLVGAGADEGDGGSSDGAIDDLLVDLPQVLVEYAQGKLFAAESARLAASRKLPPAEMRRVLLRALAAAPRPAGRPLSKRDCGRLLDAYALILADPGEA